MHTSRIYRITKEFNNLDNPLPSTFLTLSAHPRHQNKNIPTKATTTTTTTTKNTTSPPPPLPPQMAHIILSLTFALC